MKDFLGVQVLAEFYGCAADLLDQPVFIKEVMLKAAKEANATIVQQFFHQFSPYGVSGTVVIAESHINIHTWPEYDYAAVDIFTCGSALRIDAAINYLKQALKSKDVKSSTHLRGDLNFIENGLKAKRERE